jgi:DNA-binding NtrC family response regulator
MLALSSPETVSFSDTSLLQMLSSHRRRPNLMIVNEGASLGTVLEQLSGVCETPLAICRFPGHFDIEPGVKGTVVLANIEQMTLGQQLQLFDWLSHKDSETQVVSITRAPMTDLIEDGRFLEGLYFRLNTVVIRAVNIGEYSPAV